MKIPVFFRSEMIAPAPSGSFSPSASKPGPVVNAWRTAELTRRHLEIVEDFAPVSIDDIAKTHDRKHAMDVLMGDKPNGFGSTSPEIAHSLLWTNGSITRAAEHVLTGKSPVACSPTSGFHHAGPASCEGFCTFNGLVIAAYNALERGLLGPSKRVVIIDCDVHYGNGTDEFLNVSAERAPHPLLARITNETVGGERVRDGKSMLAWLRRVLAKLDPAEVGLVIYQAGADMHANDPLGGYASTEAMVMRDRLVFERCRDTDIPLVWNLAGGYQRDESGSIQPVLDLHLLTMIQCVYAYVYPRRVRRAS